MSWFIAFAFATAGALLLVGLAHRTDSTVRERLEASPLAIPTKEGLLAWVGRRIVMSRSRRRLESRLRVTSVRPIADHVVGAKVIFCAGGILFGLTALPAGPLAAACVALILAAAGFQLPDIVLARRAGAVRRRVGHQVSSYLDLVSICVTAGLSPSMALERAAGSAPQPLRGRLEEATREVALGGSWRAALHDLADRLELRDLRRLALAIERGQRLGAPVADHLRRLARDLRQERRAREEERARRAPVLMLFPLVFLILPAFVLAALIPAVIVATRGIP